MLQPRIRIYRQLCRYQALLPLSRRFYATEVALPDTRMSIPPPSNAADFMPAHDDSMAIRTYKPRTPGLRHLRRPINDHLYLGRPHHPLTIPKKGHGIGGRNVTGRITVRHRGGGHKRRIRLIDFDRMESGKWLVERIEHDPNRSAHIALLSRPKDGTDGEHDTRYLKHIAKPMDGITRDRHLPKDREYRYIIAPQGMRAGERVESFRKGIPQRLLDELGSSADAGIIAAKTAWRGNCLPLHMIPTGTIVHNVGLHRGKKAQLCRSAGTFAMVVNKNDSTDATPRYVDVRLQSGEVRRIHRDCCATVGVASNSNHNRAQLGKAGRKRWLGIRPTVRGVAMNAVDHPHGGGRGKSKGNRHPVSIWGQLVSAFFNFFLVLKSRNTCAKMDVQTKSGYKTRKRSKVNQFVVSPRPRYLGRKAKLTKQN